MALDDPFHRPAELFRRPRHHREFGIDHAAGAEIAADVLHQHADFFRRHVEHGGEIVLQPHRAAIAGIDGVAAALGVVGGERRARLHRHAGDALHPGLEPGDVGGAGKGGVGRRRVAKLAIEADVRLCAVVHPRRILARGRNGFDHGRQDVVIDHDTLGAVFRRVHGFGDDHRHRFADETRLVGRQRIMRRFERRLVAFEVQLGLLLMRRPRLVRDRFEAVRGKVHAGQHREHARRGLGVIGRDRADARMRMRRAHHHRIDLARQVLVGGIAAVAAHQAQILAPPYRLADAGAFCCQVFCRHVHHVLLTALLSCSVSPQLRRSKAVAIVRPTIVDRGAGRDDAVGADRAGLAEHAALHAVDVAHIRDPRRLIKVAKVVRQVWISSRRRMLHL